MLVKFRGYNNEEIFSEVETFTCEDLGELAPDEFNYYDKLVTLYFHNKNSQPYSMVMSAGTYELAVKTYEQMHYFVFTAGKHMSLPKIDDCADLLKRYDF